MLISSNEGQSGAAQPYLFPLSSEIFTRSIETFAGFSDQELDLISGSNIELLAPDDPVRFLLDLRVRPELHEPETDSVRRAYRAGVCLGAAIVRTSLQHLEAGGIKLEPASFDVGAAALRESQNRYRRRKLPGNIFAIIAQNAEIYDFSPYLEGRENGGLLGALKVAWMSSPHEFMSVENIDHGTDDYINIGLRDTFKEYATIYGTGPHRREGANRPARFGQTLRSKLRQVRQSRESVDK